MSSQFVRTKNLNQAAALVTWGAKLVEVVDKYPDNTFVVEAKPFHLFVEKHVGFLPYRLFCKHRVTLKEKARKQSGLPTRFTGKDEGYNFADIAMVRKFSKKELEAAAKRGIE